MKRFFRSLMTTLVAVVVFSGFQSVSAQTIRINVATVAPEKSPYGDVMRKMGAEWSRISGGKVEMKMFFGDKLGDEEAIVQKIRSNSLNGAMLTLAGLAYIDPPLLTISAPLLVDSDEKMKFVLDQLIPEINDRLAKKGFAGIVYSRAGWVQFFAKQPFHTPAELKKMKLGISNKSKEIYAAFQSMNYQVVNVDIAETLANLLTGRAEALFTSPLVAGSYNWVGSARYMLDIKISPFFGGFIINEKTWSRIPADLQKQLIESAQKLATVELDESLAKLEAAAIKQMTEFKGGLVIVKSTPEEKALWKKELEGGLSLTLGTAFDKDMYQKVQKILTQFKK